MMVVVHLHTVLQRQTPEGLVSKLEVSLAPESTLQDLLTHLEIEFPVDSMLLVVNGRLAEVDYVLRDGDQVNLMPAISGGCLLILEFISS
jgi:sulfur carrier protein ThiS